MVFIDFTSENLPLPNTYTKHRHPGRSFLEWKSSPWHLQQRYNDPYDGAVHGNVVPMAASQDILQARNLGGFRPPEVMDVLDVSWIYIIYQMFLKFEFSDCIQCKYVYIYTMCIYIHNMHVETSHNHHRSGFRNWGRIFYPFLSFLCWNHAGWRFLVQICPIIRWHELEWMRHSHEVRIAEFLSNRYLNPLIGIWQLPVHENQWHGSDFCPPFCLYGCNNLLKDRNLYDDYISGWQCSEDSPTKLHDEYVIVY